MAYARFGRESDIYVFQAVEGMICQRCKLNDYGDTLLRSRSLMLEHMNAHLQAGDKVPDYAFEELRADLAKNGDVIEQ
jgi:hypothetical protein